MPSNQAPWDILDKNRISLSFQFGSRTLFATGHVIHRNTVFKLQLCRSPLDRLLASIFSILPTSTRRWLTNLLRRPDLCLPATIILKKRKKNWDEEFENEKAMYARLSGFQGRFIPICYGEATCDADDSDEEEHNASFSSEEYDDHSQGDDYSNVQDDNGDTTATSSPNQKRKARDNVTVPALILSDIGGFALYRPEAAGLSKDHFYTIFRKPFDALASLGLLHDDKKLDNYHLVDGKIVMVDVEAIMPAGLSMSDPRVYEACVPGGISFLWGIYEPHQEYLRRNGFLD